MPNPATWPILAPIYNPNICSLNDERWELRGNELGCKVSTRTFLSVVVAVLGTVFLICAGWAVARFWMFSSTRWRGWVRSGKGMYIRLVQRSRRAWRQGSFINIAAVWSRRPKAVDEDG